MGKNAGKTVRVFTIGHSNRSFEDFVSLLKEFKVSVLADIRRYPGSRKFPHFNREVLSGLLAGKGIRYVWLESLGGRRHSAKTNESPNPGLRSAGFRGYADYMATDEFRAGIEELLSAATASPAAIMCAEKFYQRCHRRLVCDYLTALGVDVEHIVEAGKLQPHKLTAGAVVTKGPKVTYPLAASDEKPETGELFEH